MAIAVRNDDDWRALCRVMDLDALAADEELADVDGRMARHDEIDARIEAWTSIRTPMRAMETLQKAGVPAGAVQRPEDRIENDPNVREWGLFSEVEHPKMGSVRVDGMPVKLSRTPARIERGGPTLGQHNAQVFGDVLGMDESTIAEMTEQGVI